MKFLSNALAPFSSIVYRGSEDRAAIMQMLLQIDPLISEAQQEISLDAVAVAARHQRALDQYQEDCVEWQAQVKQLTSVQRMLGRAPVEPYMPVASSELTIDGQMIYDDLQTLLQLARACSITELYPQLFVFDDKTNIIQRALVRLHYQSITVDPATLITPTT